MNKKSYKIIVNQCQRNLLNLEREAIRGKLPLRQYIVCLRITSSDTNNGSSNKYREVRRKAISETLELLRPKEKHISTSTWRIESRINSAEEILETIRPLLKKKLDHIIVDQVFRKNSRSWGNPDLVD